MTRYGAFPVVTSIRQRRVDWVRSHEVSHKLQLRVQPDRQVVLLAGFCRAETERARRMGLHVQREKGRKDEGGGDEGGEKKDEEAGK